MKLRPFPIVLLTVLLAASAALAAQTPPAPVSIVMLSDIHFDPFHDPRKVAELLGKSPAQWQAVLTAPDTPTQAADYAALQKTCKGKGVDTPYALLASSLAAEHAQQPAPLFVTISGDLMAHQFDCRFATLVPHASAADYSSFAARTVAFVALQLHTTFPGVPMYFALGNNDSGCKDYREDAGSAYLKADANAFADAAGAPGILKDFPALGDYKVALPAPFQHTHLLVLQDIFESKRYTTCDGKESVDPTKAQIAWLRKELTAARAAHEHVWVMAHIPPGVDAYSTVTKGAKDVAPESCAYTTPELFLGSELFADALRDFPDVISLVLLGHTHMDEMRLYQGSHQLAIPGKLVPSISPVDGNNPSFTVASVDPAKAMLLDYTVYSASNQTGVGTKWSPEYTYSTTYHQPDFSSASVAALTHGFLADPRSSTAQSRSYEEFYFVGGKTAGINLKAAALRTVWPVYTCSITQDHIKGFTDCACGTAAKASSGSKP
jgi:sphingomyelin phosphodiesterase acid-like 3